MTCRYADRVAVLMADLKLGVRDRTVVEDPSGYVRPAGEGATRGPWPGRVRRRADNTWVLAVDAAGWPFGEGDVVVEIGDDGLPGRTWLVRSAELRANTTNSTVDFVTVEALLREVGEDGGSTPG